MFLSCPSTAYSTMEQAPSIDSTPALPTSTSPMRNQGSVARWRSGRENWNRRATGDHGTRFWGPTACHTVPVS